MRAGDRRRAAGAQLHRADQRRSRLRSGEPADGDDSISVRLSDRAARAGARAHSRAPASSGRASPTPRSAGVAAGVVRRLSVVSTFHRRSAAAPTSMSKRSGGVVTPGYFGALGMRLRAGRAIARHRYARASPPAVVVNRSFVREVPRGRADRTGDRHLAWHGARFESPTARSKRSSSAWSTTSSRTGPRRSAAAGDVRAVRADCQAATQGRRSFVVAAHGRRSGRATSRRCAPRCAKRIRPCARCGDDDGSAGRRVAVASAVVCGAVSGLRGVRAGDRRRRTVRRAVAVGVAAIARAGGATALGASRGIGDWRGVEADGDRDDRGPGDRPGGVSGAVEQPDAVYLRRVDARLAQFRRGADRAA